MAVIESNYLKANSLVLSLSFYGKYLIYHKKVPSPFPSPFPWPTFLSLPFLSLTSPSPTSPSPTAPPFASYVLASFASVSHTRPASSYSLAALVGHYYPFPPAAFDLDLLLGQKGQCHLLEVLALWPALPFGTWPRDVEYQGLDLEVNPRGLE